jgi:transcriptional regulator with XRE-family HTH domain
LTPAEFKAARTALVLSIHDMARVLGLSSTHVRRLEMDPSESAHRPVTWTVERLIHAYLKGYRCPDWGYDRSALGRAKRERNLKRKLRV